MAIKEIAARKPSSPVEIETIESHALDIHNTYLCLSGQTWEILRHNNH